MRAAKPALGDDARDLGRLAGVHLEHRYQVSIGIR